uniref:RING-type domain-containing protein n=1 Tax=Oryza punctata TaxID=4537 RepID=A0A0E0M322_ORYPU
MGNDLSSSLLVLTRVEIEIAVKIKKRKKKKKKNRGLLLLLLLLIIEPRGGIEVGEIRAVSMSTVSGNRRAPRRQPQDGPGDKVVVNLDAISSPGVGSRRAVPTSTGARASPIDVEALDDEVQTVSASQVPPPRRNRRTRRQPVAVVDLEVDASREGNKRQRVEPVIHCLSPERGEGSSLKTSKEPPKAKEPVFNCPVCWNKLEEPSTTICGHIFCTKCIKQAIQIQKKCPTCRKSLRANNFHHASPGAHQLKVSTLV